MSMIEIDAEKLRRMQQLHVSFVLIDVRSVEEFKKEHINSAFHIASGEFKKEIARMVPQKETPIVIYDEDGRTTPGLLDLGEMLGYLNMVGLEGGYKAYKNT